MKHVIWRQKPDVELKNVNVHQFSTLREDPESSYAAEMESLISIADMDDGVNIQFTSGTTGRPKVNLLRFCKWGLTHCFRVLFYHITIY